jgi:protein-S-isoprenylcysteine O-methyltransferase Ste14
MSPSLALAMVVAGGALLGLAAVGYALGWLNTGTAVALGALGLIVDSSGALLMVAARRNAPRNRRD